MQFKIYLCENVSLSPEESGDQTPMMVLIPLQIMPEVHEKNATKMSTECS